MRIEPGEVPVFWACGVTPQAAVMASRVPFAVTHAPGHMFISDVPDSTYHAYKRQRSTSNAPLQLETLFCASCP